MTKEEIYLVWATETSPWSRWVKPVLFAHMDAVTPAGPPAPAVCDWDWLPFVESSTALVLDLPGAEGVLLGVVLASKGYRPVPLYNAVPLPIQSPHSLLGGRAVVAVDVLPIVSALIHGARQLSCANLPPAAPPVFLLDANRQGDGRKMQPAEFDNRSICFTTDFPSANFLLAQGIRRVVVVQRTATLPQTDLAHVLRRWQDGGLALERTRVDVPMRPEPFTVNRPSWYGAVFQRALAAIGLRRASGGGFGAWMPESPAGG